MPRLAINTMTTFRWSFEEDVQRLAALGVQAIGVWRQKLSDFGEEKGIELLRDSGLAVSSLLWAGGFTGSDGRNYRETIDDAHDAIRLAAEMQAGCLIVYSGGRAGHTHNHARRLFRGAMQEILPLATQLGVTLAIEPMHPGCAGEGTFLTSLDDGLAVVETLESPRVRLVFDVYHLCQGPVARDRLEQIAPHVGLVQLGDALRPPQGETDRVRLGQGKLPLADVVQALLAGGYAGDVEIELMGPEFEATDYTLLVRESLEAAGGLLQV